MKKEEFKWFALGLRRMINDSGLTDGQFAKLAGISNVTLSRTLSQSPKNRTKPSEKTRVKVTAALDTSIDIVNELGRQIDTRTPEKTTGNTSPFEHLTSIFKVLDDARNKIVATAGILAEDCQAAEGKNKALAAEVDVLSNRVDSLLHLKHLRKAALEQVRCVVFVYDIDKKLVISTNPFSDATAEDLVDLYTVTTYAQKKFIDGHTALENILRIYKEQKPLTFRLVTVITKQVFEYRCVPLFNQGEFIGVFVEATEEGQI